ncbi:MAG: acid--CoA ligase [Saprospiraceae bacterium]|nr:MAG: acid--CoA ligase [Saprospiraceae bacterium]
MELFEADWAAKWAIYHPHKIAFKQYESGATLKFEQLNKLGNRLAHELSVSYNLQKGDRVAVLAENCLEYLMLLAAAQKMGFILVPLNYRLAVAEIDFLLNDAQPQLVIVEDRFNQLLAETKVFPKLPCIWPLEDLKHFCDPTVELAQDVSFKNAKIEADDPLFILYTSGTTGFPKGALYTHKMLFWNSLNTAMSLIVNSESRTVNCMPPFHTGGWNVLMMPFFHHGGYTCLLKKFDPELVLQLLESESVTIFMGVPTMLKMMAELPAFKQTTLPNLHYIIAGGEPMPIPLIEQWHQKEVPIRQGYGMTEVGPNLTSLHQEDAVRKKGSIGRPNFYVSIKIADAQGQEKAPGQAGELLLKGPMVTPGYWRNPTATAQAIQHGWFHSGDMAIRDKEGYLYIVDRIKNMFISGGENVYPAEVERALLSHTCISEAAVIGVKDEKWGEVGKAFVVLTSGACITETQLVQHCKTQLAGFKVPKYFVFVAALPKNDTGKIDRRALIK